MGKKSKTQTPTPMDTTAIGQQQATQNRQVWNQNLNAARPNQTNPFGSLTWEQDPTTGQWTQSVGLSDAQQGLMGGLTGAANTALGGYDASNIDFSTLGEMPKVGGYNQQAIDTMRALQAPQLEQQRAAQEAKLAAMGLNTGSGRAWENAQRAIGTNENQADMQAILAGINQGNTEYGQAMQGRQQGVNEMLGQKQANLGQLSGLMGLRQSVGSPAFQSIGQTPQLGNVDYTQLANQAYQQQLNTTNAANADKAASNQAKTGILGTVAGIAAKFL